MCLVVIAISDIDLYYGPSYMKDSYFASVITVIIDGKQYYLQVNDALMGWSQ